MTDKKRNMLAWGLILLIFIGFSIYNTKKQDELKIVQHRIDSINRISQPRNIDNTTSEKGLESENVSPTPILQNSIAQQQRTQEETTIENEKLIITFNNRGGKISSVLLKEYQSYNDFKQNNNASLCLFKDEGNDFYAKIYTKQDNFNTSELFFDRYTSTPIKDNFVDLVTSSDSLYQLSYRLPVGEGQYVEYLYSIAKTGYDVGFEIRFVNMENLLIPNMVDFELFWKNTFFRQEKGFVNENNFSTIAYHSMRENDFEDLGYSKEGKAEEITTKLGWVAFKQQFFSAIILSEEQPFTLSKLAFQTYSGEENKKDSHLLKTYTAELTVPITKESGNKFGFRYYFVPNHYQTLKQYGQDFERLVPLGWGIFGFINRWLVIPLFNFLDNYILNYGFIILILTIIVKLVLSPLTYRSHKSLAKRRVLKPEMDKITKKYPKREDALKKQQELNLLFKRTGVSQFGGCLPMLLQLPFLLALFNFFPSSIELRQKAFLWAEDLSTFDSIFDMPFSLPFYGNHISLFTLLMAVTLFFTSKMNMNSSVSEQSMPGMRFMSLYLMPIMLVFWFNSYACGLTYYYFLSNFIAIAQNFVIQRMIDEDKILAKINERSKRPVKKSRWQMKLEEMQRKQHAQRNRK